MRKVLDESDPHQSQSGQAVVEYMLTLVLAISVAVIINNTFKKTVKGLWEVFTREISAPCPACPPLNQNLRLGR